MKRVVVTANAIDVIEAERPTPRQGEALVRTSVAGVCGSDVHAAAGHHPFLKPPYAPGHETVGRVEAIADGVTDVRVGDRVIVNPTLPCWECKMCQLGLSNLCERLQFFGCGYPQGGMSDQFTIPANRLTVVPSSVTDLEAVLVEPFATPVHAVRLSGGVEGRTVVILGAGTIGLFVLAAARAAGARRVVMSDPLESKRERALSHGADAVVDPSDDARTTIRAALGESADVVFDCVSVQSTIDLAIGLAIKGGTVVVVGVPAGPVTVGLPEIQDYQVRVQGSATYEPQDFEEALRLIEARAISVDDFITARFPLARAAEAFSRAATGEEVKVVLELSSTS